MSIPDIAGRRKPSSLRSLNSRTQSGNLLKVAKAIGDLPLETKSALEQIDAIVKKYADWRGERLSQLRVLVRKADPGVVEEVKWKKPSNPMGVPVWSHDGIVCIGEALKNRVRLTFPKGAMVKDPKKLFNTRLDSKSVRAIDFHENDTTDEQALKQLVLEAVRLNLSKAK